MNRSFNFLVLAFCIIVYSSCQNKADYPAMDREGLATRYFQNDTAWYLKNIPFFECSDQQIEQVYYYRWKLYKAHIRQVGPGQYVITEFIDHMGFDRAPYCTINAASMHHIHEGRWLRDDQYIDGYINYLYQDGGNNLQYSESIADAACARYLVNADSGFVISQLDSMQRKYDGWSDHWDGAKQLYYIPAMPDATEYTIASIDASGGKDGFAGGEAFRPTINSYMYGNARAISKIAAMKGDTAVSNDYARRASELKATVERSLWNDSMQHFIDRFKVNNQYVHYWDFIRGRELAGFAPWYFNLPTDDPKYHAAWKHVLDTSRLRGKFGLRTNEPSYQYYFKQFVFNGDKPGSQWNGPTWPYASSQAITGMANVLNDYHQKVVTITDYVRTLRQFALEHYLPDGKINLVENYDPNKGGPIVYFYWSNHYNHSSFNNLVITGLCGIRPSAGDSLIINPLVDYSINYFRLQDVLYHGHRLTLIYDRDGKKYNIGEGLSVFVDGKKREIIVKDGKSLVVVRPAVVREKPKPVANLALNIRRKGFPTPSASINSVSDSLYQAIDGRVWYFPEIRNRWSTMGSTSTTDWFALDFGEPRDISSLKYALYTDSATFGIPDGVSVEYRQGEEWVPLSFRSQRPLGNTDNTLIFNKVSTNGVRVVFSHKTKQVAISEVGCYE